MTEITEEEREKRLDAAIAETQAAIDEIRSNSEGFDELCRVNGIDKNKVPRLADVAENEETSPEIKELARDALAMIDEVKPQGEQPGKTESGRKRSPKPSRRGVMRI